MRNQGGGPLTGPGDIRFEAYLVPSAGERNVLGRKPRTSPKHLVNDPLNLRLMPIRLQCAIVIERFTGPTQSKLFGRNPALQVQHQRLQVGKRTQSTQCAVGRGQQPYDLACQRVTRSPDRMALDRAAGPVDGVLQQAGVTGVVLGRDDDPGRVRVHGVFEADHIGGRAARFKVGVVQRNVEVRELDVGDISPGGACQIGGGGGETAGDA